VTDRSLIKVWTGDDWTDADVEAFLKRDAEIAADDRPIDAELLAAVEAGLARGLEEAGVRCVYGWPDRPFCEGEGR